MRIAETWLDELADELVGNDTTGIEEAATIAGLDMASASDVEEALGGRAQRCGICGVWQFAGECGEDGCPNCFADVESQWDEA